MFFAGFGGWGESTLKLLRRIHQYLCNRTTYEMRITIEYSKGEVYQQDTRVSDKTKTSAFLKNRFHTSECTRLNKKKGLLQDDLSKSSCVDGVTFLVEATRLPNAFA